jgi:hypothetical protein
MNKLQNLGVRGQDNEKRGIQGEGVGKKEKQSEKRKMGKREIGGRGRRIRYGKKNILLSP